MTDIEPPHSMGPYLIAVVSAICANYALAWLFARLHVAHALTGLASHSSGWFAFLFVTIQHNLDFLRVSRTIPGR